MRRILVTPLDWGLGHASRCIPIINNLLGRGFEVILAGSGDSIELLKVEFPTLNTFGLPGYKPEYSKSGAMIWKMLLQLPKFTAVMRREHKAIEEIVKREHIDLVISDNRYGCWSAKVPSVFITHQTNIQLPPSLKWLSRFVRLYNTRAINRFTQCWIPDNPGSHSLTGKLVKRRNHGIRKLIYIGNISRFEHAEPIPAIYDVLFILSGPEPQRTIFENIALREALTSGLKYFIVRGVPLPDTPLHPGVKHADFLPTFELQSLISKSSCIIARSGYSMIM
ncbi:MAG TPA: hypothetical protein VK666_13915, partial [Chryseolinea sp.]|nr:hypothetical protein [Chryseolinea sp.]